VLHSGVRTTSTSQGRNNLAITAAAVVVGDVDTLLCFLSSARGATSRADHAGALGSDELEDDLAGVAELLVIVVGVVILVLVLVVPTVVVVMAVVVSVLRASTAVVVV
jgi:hypothetical protein